MQQFKQQLIAHCNVLILEIWKILVFVLPFLVADHKIKSLLHFGFGFSFGFGFALKCISQAQ
jgi:hypothetical protein